MMEPPRSSMAYSAAQTSEVLEYEQESQWADDANPPGNDGEAAGDPNVVLDASGKPKRQRKQINKWHVERRARKEREKKERLLYCPQIPKFDLDCSADAWRRACTMPDCGRCCTPQCAASCGVITTPLHALGLVRCPGVAAQGRSPSSGGSRKNSISRSKTRTML